jgi:hypothetical protein
MKQLRTGRRLAIIIELTRVKVIEWYSYLLNNKTKFNINEKELLFKIIEIEEGRFEAAVKEEVNQRKFRLGAPPVSQIQDEVNKELIVDCPLNEFYESCFLLDPADITLRNKYILFLIKKIKVRFRLLT